MKPDGEFVIFGDEKQNIYDRPLDEEKEIVAKGIPGAWNKSLKVSIRFTENIAKIAARFQQTFLGKKYNLDQLMVINQPELGFASRIDYHALPFGAGAEAFFSIISHYIQEQNIHPSDIGVLGATVEKIREIDRLIRTNLGEKTTTMFEKQEYFEEKSPSKQELEDARRFKKLHFYMKTGTMKLSTIHSFKGWEIDTLFLVIDDINTELGSEAFTTNELIYTAITRAKRNLIILNSASEAYHQFFDEVGSASPLELC